MKDKQELNEEPKPLLQEQEREEENEISLDELEDVSGSAANPRPRERGSSRRSTGF